MRRHCRTRGPGGRAGCWPTRARLRKRSYEIVDRQESAPPWLGKRSGFASASHQRAGTPTVVTSPPYEDTLSHERTRSPAPDLRLGVPEEAHEGGRNFRSCDLG